MAAAGYSGTPLVKKLGIKPGARCRFANPPRDYDKTLGTLPDDVTLAKTTRGSFDFIHLFAESQRQLERELPKLKAAMVKDGMLWISWPKKSSGVMTDVTEAIVRQAGLDVGLVDVKICAVDETWSGLKFMYRRADR